MSPALAAGTLVNGLISESSAQTNSNGSNASSMGLKVGSQIMVLNPINFTGSIPLRYTINKSVTSIVKVSLIEVVSNAQKLIGSNSSATLAVIRPLIGYLVYEIHVRSNSQLSSLEARFLKHALIMKPVVASLRSKE